MFHRKSIYIFRLCQIQLEFFIDGELRIVQLIELLVTIHAVIAK